MELEEFFEKHQERIDWASYKDNVEFKSDLEEKVGGPVTILPCSDAVNGEYGFIFSYWDEEDKEHSVTLMNKVFDSATQVKHESFISIKKVYDQAIKDGVVIEKCGNPKQLLLGFIITTATDRIWHTITVREYKRRQISRPLKQQEKPNMEDLAKAIAELNRLVNGE